MTKHVVADDALGMVNRRRWEIERRLMEGTLDPSFVARNFQTIAEGSDVAPASSPNTTCPFFADEEKASTRVYPANYAVKPVCEQLVELSRHFPSLNSSSVLACSKEMPSLPGGAEGWFAVPKFKKVGKNYNDAVEKVLEMIGKTRSFTNWRKGELSQKYLRLSERTAVALQMLGQKQEGDFLLIPAQFGILHRGKSVRRVRMTYASHEFGLGSFVGATMLLAHPERLQAYEDLFIDLPGDEYSPGADGRFDGAPFFDFRGGRALFSTHYVGIASGGFGSASGFIPQ